MTIQTKMELRTFQRDEQGAVAMFFALILTTLIIMIGAAIDLGRALHASNKLSSALDIAALAAAEGLHDTAKTDAELQDLALRFFRANMQGNAANFTNVDSVGVTIDRPTNTVTMTAAAWIPTTFTAIAGITRVNLPKTAVVSFSPKALEVGLQLDVTGSMDQTIGGVKKIDSLKIAVADLLDILLPSSGPPAKTRVGIAPFSAGVNAGAYAGAVTGGRAYDGCTYERIRTADDATDYAPVGLDTLKATSDLVPNPNAYNGTCPNAQVIAMTTDKAALNASVAAYQAGGSTAGHLGSAWAWYLVSPNWSGIWPSASQPVAYNDPKTDKSVILMTDGIYNTVGGVSEGDYGPEAIDSARRARNNCDAMRAKNIKIYTVGFIKAGDDPNAALTLQYCAGDPSRFFKVQDEAQLRLAFQQIAKDISKIHLTR